MQRLRTGALMLALVLGAAGVATAASGGSTNTVVACVRHKDGGMYIAKKCARRDSILRWSVTGPRGATGPQGPQGAAGPQGLQGNSGAPGPLLSTLPSSKTETGVFEFHGSAAIAGTDYRSTPIDFWLPLASTPTVHVLLVGDPQTPNARGAPQTRPLPRDSSVSTRPGTRIGQRS